MEAYRFTSIKNNLVSIWNILKTYPELDVYAKNVLSVVDQHLSDTHKKLKQRAAEAENKKQGKIFIE